MKSFLKHAYLLIIIINFFSSFAQDTIKIDDSLYAHRELSISQYYFFDTAKIFDIKKLDQIKFQLERKVKPYEYFIAYFSKADTAKANNKIVSIDSSIKGVWLKFTLKNITNHQINYLIEDTTVYSFIGNNIVSLNNSFEKINI